jgi:hypothetical protein
MQHTKEIDILFVFRFRLTFFILNTGLLFSAR